MKEWKIKDWGCEVEISNYPLVARKDQYEDLGFIRNNKENEIINNIDGFLFMNDPTGKKLDFGGELNSRPFKTKEELMETCMELERRMNLTEINYLGANSPFHVHITLEDGVLEDLSEVARFCDWLVQNHEYLRAWFQDPFHYEVKSDFGWPLTSTPYVNLAYHCRKFKTWEEMRPYYGCKIEGYYGKTDKQLQMLQAFYKRPWFNFTQYYQSKTIEIRSFELRTMSDGYYFVKFIEQLIEAFNRNDLSIIEKYPESYQIKPIYPPRYIIKKTTYKDYLKKVKGEV